MGRPIEEVARRVLLIAPDTLLPHRIGAGDILKMA
jgi:hypothetical protein